MPKRYLKKQTNSFQERVYKTVRKISKGKVITYNGVAKLAGCPRACRAVGNILNKSKGIPCHRVISSDGKIGGYKYGIKKKIALLKKEGIIIDSHGKITPRFIK